MIYIGENCLWTTRAEIEAIPPGSGLEKTFQGSSILNAYPETKLKFLTAISSRGDLNLEGEDKWCVVALLESAWAFVNKEGEVIYVRISGP
ncbi:MAG: hypothetical protein FD146_2263 [Anaerolineaceae bacterium]|nr:MAG: hypothetical protein FD146_2263 [Anaerolineaceae bacterium]